MIQGLYYYYLPHHSRSSASHHQHHNGRQRRLTDNRALKHRRYNRAFRPIKWLPWYPGFPDYSGYSSYSSFPSLRAPVPVFRSADDGQSAEKVPEARAADGEDQGNEAGWFGRNQVIFDHGGVGRPSTEKTFAILAQKLWV